MSGSQLHKLIQVPAHTRKAPEKRCESYLFSLIRVDTGRRMSLVESRKACDACCCCPH